VEPTFRGLQEDGRTYKGVVYFGIMVTEAGPMLLEYNVRFGDPEAQVVLPLIQNDFADLSEALAHGTLDRIELRISDQSALGVVVAAPGYPSSYPRHLPIDPLPTPSEHEAVVFHASTTREGDELFTGGGRCFTVVGFGGELLQARANAYKTAKEVTFPGSWIRPDIGGRIFGK
jgi:phosphoribosylamine-glycine ligase